MPDVFNPLTFTEEAEREIRKGYMRFFERKYRWCKNYWNNWERLYTLSISHDRWECVGEDQEQTNATLRRSGQARKRANLTWFMYYVDWLRELRFNSSNAHPTLKDCKFGWNAWDDVSHKLNVTYNLFSSFITFVFGVFFLLFFFFCGRKLRVMISGKQI